MQEHELERILDRIGTETFPPPARLVAEPRRRCVPNPVPTGVLLGVSLCLQMLTVVVVIAVLLKLQVNWVAGIGILAGIAVAHGVLFLPLLTVAREIAPGLQRFEQLAEAGQAGTIGP